MYFSDGEYKTSHYAICTSFMALSMILPGLGAGYIQEGTSPNQKSITYTVNDSISLSAPIGYDKDMLYFNGWATITKDSAGNLVEQLVAKPSDTIVVTKNQNLFASFSDMQFIKYSIEFKEPSKIASNTDMLLYTIKADTLPAPLDKKRYDKEKKAEKKNPHRTKLPIGKANIYTDLELDTIFTPIPLTKMYSKEQLNAPTIQSADTSKVILQFTTAEGKMSDYRWFFWMVICCSLATFFVTFLAYKRVDPNYGKK
jgi:hypothetical protein